MRTMTRKDFLRGASATLLGASQILVSHGYPIRSSVSARETANLPSTAGRVLPDGLTAVEYLESSRAQYIDTGVYGTINTSVDIEFAFTDGLTTFNGVFGSRQSWANRQFLLARWDATAGRSYTGQIAFCFGNYGNIPDIMSGIMGTTAEMHSAHLARSWTIDSVSRWFDVPDFTTPVTLKMFAIHYGYGNTFSLGAVRIFSCTINEGGALVRDFQPVRFFNEDEEQEGAMYDFVSGELFFNQGTGSFVIGPDK